MIFFRSWQQYHNFSENTEKIKLKPKYDLCRGPKYFFIFIVRQQRHLNPQALNHLAKF